MDSDGYKFTILVGGLKVRETKFGSAFNPNEIIDKITKPARETLENSERVLNEARSILKECGFYEDKLNDNCHTSAIESDGDETEAETKNTSRVEFSADLKLTSLCRSVCLPKLQKVSSCA